MPKPAGTPIQLRAERATSPALASSLTVKLQSDLSAAAFKSKQTRILILWLQLRALDTTGDGYIELSEALAGLQDVFQVSPTTGYEVLRRGNGKLWEIVDKRRTTLRIYGLLVVCRYFSILMLSDKHWHLVPSFTFKGAKACRAQLYASLHKPLDIRGNPMSRATIEARTGLSKVQQRRYEIAAGIKRTSNYAFQFSEGCLSGSMYQPVKREIFTRAQGHRTINGRFGNSYRTQQIPGRRGMLSKTNRALRGRSFIPTEALPLVKRFFSTYKKLIRAITKHTTMSKDTPSPCYRINTQYRAIRGRQEWCICLI